MPDDENLVRQRLSRLWPVRPAETPIGPSPRPVVVATAEAAGADGSDDRMQPSPLDQRSPLSLPGAFDPGRRGVRALAVFAVVVMLAAGGWAWHSRPRTELVAPAPLTAGSGVAEPAASATSAGGSDVVVAVAGRVRRPGLVRLPAGARVADALAAAGGVLPGTDPALLNLARRVTDGELIVVGVTPPPGAPGPPGGAAPGAGPAAKVNLNTATAAQLDALPGVGPVLAQRIIDYRERHGGFRSVSDLRQVDGIGDARYEQLKDLVSV